jgi:hypothetical protein
MIKLLLNRDIHTSTETCGHVSLEGRKWATIERPWLPCPDGGKAGKKGFSCVPVGEYKLERHSTDAYPSHWALVNHELGVYHWPWEVPKHKEAWARTAVLIHSANWAHELRGCIAPGKARFRDGNGRWYVDKSRDALNEIRTLLGRRVDLVLVITGSKE